MTLKKLAYHIHLWLGLTSGIIVFIVCITGAIWVFNEEITALTEGNLVKPEAGASVLQPSEIEALCDTLIPGKALNTIRYQKDKPVRVHSWGPGHSIALFLDPYSGKLFKSIDYWSSNGKIDFFSFILQGHRFLWLPWQIGRPIVNYATLLFVLVLITGMVLWWPKTKKAFKAVARFKWKKGLPLRRKMFDLHNILGFYAFLVLLTIALTGMVWGLQWYSKGLYRLTAVGKPLPLPQKAQSDTTGIVHYQNIHNADLLIEKLTKAYPLAEVIELQLPNRQNPESVIKALIQPEAGKRYNRDILNFDQYTLKEIPLNGPDNGKYQEASLPDKIRRMNYDIHTGSILGLPGKILAFIAALMGASLPVTGVYLWLKKKKYL